MKIGVISDTHLSKPTEALCSLTDGIFADVAMILHAGDLTSIEILDAFSGKEVVAVCGNMDRYDVAQKLPTKEIVHVDGYRIGLIHGWGSRGGVEDKIVDDFQDVDAIVYGHTHKAANHVKNGVLMFNPGAFSGSLLFGRTRSVGLLTIEDGIRGKIINL
jgi:putative phosphoesterase